MKQPSAPDLYPELPIEEIEKTKDIEGHRSLYSLEDGQNYRLQKISEIEKTLINERDIRKALYKKYKRGINITDGVDTTLISSSVILATVGITVPILLPLEIVAAVCGGLGIFVKLIRRRLTTKSKKHYEIKTIAESKLNSLKDLISKSLTDGQISESEFKLILDELDKYNKLKENIHSKQKELKQRTREDSLFSESEKKKLIEETEARVRNEIKKKIENVSL